VAVARSRRVRPPEAGVLKQSPTSAADVPYRVIEIHSWKRYQQIVAGPEYRSWAFRGQSDASWPLFSSLSRYLIQYRIDPRAWPEQEMRSLRIFRRKAHLFLNVVPPDDDSFQWLAMMQHFGAPTRLLDFTWSPFVAGFFALERATKDAAVWGLSLPRLWKAQYKVPGITKPKKHEELGMRTPGNYERFFIQNRIPFVATGEPMVMNQRLVAQSGTFVVPGLLDKPVDDIISNYEKPESALTKFVLKTAEIREEAMYSFYNMNITNASLFPGLDGLARSLAYEIEYHWGYNPRNMEPYEGYGP
jgi:hypothetical protein